MIAHHDASGAPSAAPSTRRNMTYQRAAAIFAERMTARAAHNVDNRTRTAFYLDFWRAHPEITWALLAHLVSRNAGYQMTDFRRHLERLERTGGRSGRLGGLWRPLAGRAGHLARQIVRFLEAGNFLIFHDAYPQLVAYAAAKQALEALGGAPLSGAGRLFDDLPRHGVDPHIAAVWRSFFADAARHGFFRHLAGPDRNRHPRVVQMALASVVNEQSYLEDRLLSPGAGVPRYVDPDMPFATLFALGAAFGLTRLAFAGSRESSPHVASQIWVHVFGEGAGAEPSFASLSRRIHVGRLLYHGVFIADRARAEAIARWAEHGPPHTGSRAAYDPRAYTPMSRRKGLLSRPLPGGPLPDWPLPPAPHLPTWSERFPRAAMLLPSAGPDPFEEPLGFSCDVVSRRPLAEIVDPARLSSW